MKTLGRMTSAALGAALVIGSGVAAPPAEAAYVVDLTQVADPSQPSGFDVVATGSGTIDLTDLSFNSTIGIDTGIGPIGGNIAIGTFGSADTYTGFTGPTSFGSGGGTAAGGGTGDLVGIDNTDHQIDVLAGYTSGHSLSSALTIDNTTFASLGGVTPGTYVWTWGSGAHADSFTLDIVAATVVPEPSTWAMMLVGFAGLGFAGWRARGGFRLAA